MAKSSKFGFKKVQSALNQATKEAAIDMMRASKQYFKEGFENGGLAGEEKWAEVSRRIEGTRYHRKQEVWAYNHPTGKYIKINQGDDWHDRLPLNGTTGRLKYKTWRANSSITNKGMTSVMTNPMKYAGYIQNGTPYMVARPFMTHTKALEAIHLKILMDKTGKVWQAV